MKTFRQITYEWKKTERLNYMFWPPAIVVVLAIAAFATNTIATHTNKPGPEEHTGPIPEHVIQLSAESYLIDTSRSVTESDICRGSSDSNPAIRDSRRIEELNNLVYVQCYMDQKWNVLPNGPPNLEDAAVLTFKHPGWWIPSASLLFLALIYPFLVIGNEIIKYPGHISEVRRDRRRKEEELQEKIGELESRRRELIGAWSRNEITDDVFDSKLEDLVRQGLPREK